MLYLGAYRVQRHRLGSDQTERGGDPFQITLG